MAGRYCEEKIKMVSEKVSRKMVLEIKYVNANNAVIHTENSKLLLNSKISLGTGIWAKFRLGTGIWYPPSRPSSRREDMIDHRSCAHNVSSLKNIFRSERDSNP